MKLRRELYGALDLPRLQSFEILDGFITSSEHEISKTIRHFASVTNRSKVKSK